MQSLSLKLGTKWARDAHGDWDCAHSDTTVKTVTELEPDYEAIVIGSGYGGGSFRILPDGTVENFSR